MSSSLSRNFQRLCGAGGRSTISHAGSLHMGCAALWMWKSPLSHWFMPPSPRSRTHCPLDAPSPSHPRATYQCFASFPTANACLLPAITCYVIPGKLCHFSLSCGNRCHLRVLECHKVDPSTHGQKYHSLHPFRDLSKMSTKWEL